VADKRFSEEWKEEMKEVEKEERTHVSLSGGRSHQPTGFDTTFVFAKPGLSALSIERRGST